MQRFVAQENIQRLGQLLKRDCGADREVLLRSLLCAERAKLAALDAELSLRAT